MKDQLEECEICFALCKAESIGKHRISHTTQARLLMKLLPAQQEMTQHAQSNACSARSADLNAHARGQHRP